MFLKRPHLFFCEIDGLLSFLVLKLKHWFEGTYWHALPYSILNPWKHIFVFWCGIWSVWVVCFHHREKQLTEERNKAKEDELRRREMEIRNKEMQFEQRLQNEMAQWVGLQIAQFGVTVALGMLAQLGAKIALIMISQLGVKVALSMTSQLGVKATLSMFIIYDCWLLFYNEKNVFPPCFSALKDALHVLLVPQSVQLQHFEDWHF